MRRAALGINNCGHETGKLTDIFNSCLLVKMFGNLSRLSQPLEPFNKSYIKNGLRSARLGVPFCLGLLRSRITVDNLVRICASVTLSSIVRTSSRCEAYSRRRIS